jgi:carbon-monoxide dehydrogenase medium subunit
MEEFEHYVPTTLEEVIKLLIKFGRAAKLLAGGTDLLVFMRQRRITPTCIIELSRIRDLTAIEEKQEGLFVGACVRLGEIERNSLIRRLFIHVAEAAGNVGSMQIRNLATIGGNICTASPAGDMIPALMVSDAQLHIVGVKGRRIIPISDFFKGPGETTLEETDVLVGIYLPLPKPNTGTAFIKLGVRGAMDISIANVAARVTLNGTLQRVEEVRVALGSVAPTVILSKSVERYLVGASVKEAIEGLIEKAADSVMDEVKPITDHRASAQYRRLMAAVLTKRALRIALQRAMEKSMV